VSALTVNLPEAVDEVYDDQGDVHLYCCRPDVALCGEDLADGEDTDGEPADCIRCEVVAEAGVPCGAPFCRLRQRWRDWRS
jgi:hypothetical protein